MQLYIFHSIKHLYCIIYRLTTPLQGNPNNYNKAIDFEAEEVKAVSPFFPSIYGLYPHVHANALRTLD